MISVENIALASLSALFVLVGIYYVYKSIQVVSLYIFDGADARAVSILPFSIAYVINIVLVIVFMHSKQVSVELNFIILLIYGAMLIQLVRGRLLGYPCVKISNTKKNILFITGCFTFQVMILSGLILINHSKAPYTFDVFTMEALNNFIYCLISGSEFQSPLQLAIYVGCLVVLSSIIYYFDKKESRSKHMLKKDALLFLVIILHIFMDIVPKHVGLSFAIPVFLILNSVVFIHLHDEFGSIIRRASPINTKIASCNESIAILTKSLSKKKKFTKSDTNKINFIASLMKEDQILRESILGCWTLKAQKKAVLRAIRAKLQD
jgi:hypothetical protein